MNNIRKYTAWLGAGAIIMTLATGCPAPNDTAAGNVADATAESTANVVDGAADATSNVADAAANTTANVADAASNALAPAGQALENSAKAGASNVEALADAATMTPKIKTALGASAAMKGSKIDVDTLGEKNQIALRGTVTSAAQKTLAETIAKKEAPGYTIVNQLKTGAM